MPLNDPNTAISQENQWDANVSEFRRSIPAGPVLTKGQISEMLVRVIVLEDSVKIARANYESQDTLLDLQLQVAVAASHAYKMASIQSLAVARVQGDLFAVETNLKAWKTAEHMIEAVHAEMMMRARNRQGA